MTISDNTLCVADTNYCTIYDFANTQEEANIIWAKATAKEKDKDFFKWSVMTYAEFKQGQRIQILSLPLHETTEKRFNDMRNVLPPIKVCTINGIEMFCLSVMFANCYALQYAHDQRNDKYYTKRVDVTDKSTWINTLII